MSEFQYHEWQTVDRVLSAEEQAAVRGLSSHIEVSASRAIVTYHWSSFRHDPKQVLLNYFDAYLYLANWGSLRLMFRFPTVLLEETDIAPYCTVEGISLETVGPYQVLDLDFNAEEGEDWVEAEAGLSLFTALRADLADGDYRLLYLAWLNAMTLAGAFAEAEDENDDDPDSLADDREPPVPPGLKKLSPPLQNVIQVFDLDPFLIQAAAEASADSHATTAVNYREAIGQLTTSERDEFLVRLAAGEAGVGLALRKRLRPAPARNRPPAARPRTVRELFQRARQLEGAEHKRQAEAARQQHLAEMNALAAREAQTWQQVDDLLAEGRKIASVYDEVTATLEKLKQLADFKNRPAEFQAHMRQLTERYRSRPSLIERWTKRGWI